MPQFDPQVLSSGQEATARALQDRNALSEANAKQTARIAGLQARIAALEASGQAGPAAALRTELTEALAQRAAQQKQRQELYTTWGNKLKDFLQRVEPCDADPTVPLLLLPVRLETRFTP